MGDVRGNLDIHRSFSLGGGWEWVLWLREGKGNRLGGRIYLTSVGDYTRKHAAIKAAHREAKRLGIEIVTETIE